MFRNIYIQAYKNSIQQNSTLQVMLIHANHIYAGLGCIIQDIQFMVGNVLTHIKNIGSVKTNVKNQAKQRVSMPEKLEKLEKLDDISFKMPKYQFLPSSSLKYDNFQSYKPRLQEPQHIRSRNKQQNISRRNDSFEEMFPQKKKTKQTIQRQSSNIKLSSNPIPSKNQSVPQSQEDFMDYLFKKKNK